MTLPTGFRIQLRPDLHPRTSNEQIVGGSPVKVLRISPRAANLLRNGSLVVTDRMTAAVADRLLSADVVLPVAVLPGSPADVTVVIPVKDDPAGLDRALTAIGGSLRAIVVDDGSRSAAALREVAARHHATIVRHESNRGPAAARNTGLGLATTPFVALVDADVQVEAEVLLMLSGHFTDPELAAIGPRIVPRPVANAPWHARFDIAASSLDLGVRPGLVRPGANVGWLPSACLVVRTDRLQTGFDETLRFGEDVDLIWRLVASAQRVRYEPTFIALHDSRPNPREWLSRKYLYGTSAAPLARRHPNALSAAVITPEIGIAAAAVLLRTRSSVPIAAAGFGLAWWRLRRILRDDRLSAELARAGLWSGVTQESGLLLRHWWPATLVASLFSRNVRRATASALVIDAAVATLGRVETNPLEVFAAHRLDDAAYGAGVWSSCIRARSFRALRVRRPSAR